VMMISHSVDISIAIGGEEMVRAYLLVLFFLFFFSFCYYALFVLGTKSFMPREL